MSWMCCIFGCIVFLDELVIIGLGIRLRQGFAGGLRVGYKPDDRSHPKIKQKKRASKISLQSSRSIKEGGYLLSRIALQYHRRKRA